MDFNAGFGGRSLAFRDCGFSVVAAAESDPVKQEILRGIIPDVPVFTEPISLENLSSLPGTDILMADIPAESLARLRVNQINAIEAAEQAVIEALDAGAARVD